MRFLQTLQHLVLCVVGVSLLSACAVDPAERILPSEVTSRNANAFEGQVRRDLPLGTPKSDVESYLTGWKIDHSYAPGPRYENTFWAAIKDVKYRGSELAWLVIRIHLNAEERVGQITFALEVNVV